MNNKTLNSKNEKKKTAVQLQPKKETTKSKELNSKDKKKKPRQPNLEERRKKNTKYCGCILSNILVNVFMNEIYSNRNCPS